MSTYRVAPELDPDLIRATLAGFTFEHPLDPNDAISFAANSMSQWQVHTPHPMYYGLFNPAPTTMGIAADALVAAFNPQIAAWSHNPFAAEVENHLIQAFSKRFGYAETCDGTFASGGMEANHTAVICALVNRFPQIVSGGLRALPAQPVFYASVESHHSFRKVARLTGLGDDSLRLIGVDEKLQMLPDELEARIEHDLSEGSAPFLIVGTAGTTNAGATDPLLQCVQVARSRGLWFHTDAAWGGAAALVPELASLLNGIEQSDSITFDAHKWLSVPMGAAMFLTRDKDILSRSFRVATAYMPREASGLDIVDPHLHSIQWSRRFIGLKLFLSLLVAGWDGYGEAIRHQTRMGDLLREKLSAAKYRIENDTPLPVVCFSDPGGGAELQQRIALQIVASGKAWISSTLLAGTRTVLRACITNYLTRPEHIDAFVELLAEERLNRELSLNSD